MGAAVVAARIHGKNYEASVVVSDFPETSETEPNGTSTPQPLPVPGGVTGAFGERNDRDCYRFTAKAGQVLVLNVDARELDSMADPVLRVQDAAGKTLATADDSDGGRDPRLFWTAPADGEYRVLVQDVASVSRGGAAFFYRLTVAPPSPVLALTLPGPALVLKPGQKLEVAVTVVQSWQPEAVTVRVEGLPPGVTAEPVSVPAAARGSSSTPVKLVLTAAADAKPGHAAVRVVGQAGPLVAQGTAAWDLAKDRSGTLARGSTRVVSLVLPTP